MTDGAITPLQQTHLFGHLDVLQTWQQAFQNQKLHHGLLVTGPQGVGKATLVFQFLKWLFQQSATQPQFVEKQILAGSYPGLKIITRLFDEKKQRYAGEITLDAVQPIFDFLRLSVMGGGYRAIVIDGADTMNRNAQNTILKLLEEPPQKTFFFLLVEQPGLMLPTIRSRCMRYNLASLSPDVFHQAMQSIQPDLTAAERDGLYGLCGGHPGQATLLHQQDWQQLYTETIQAAIALQDAPKAAMKWAEQYGLAANDTAYDLIQDMLTKRLGQIVAQRQNGQGGLSSPLIPAEAPLLAAWQQTEPRRLLDAYDRMTQLFRTGDRSHLDRKLVLLQALRAFTGAIDPVASTNVARYT